MTKGYHNYRGRGRRRRQQIALAVALVVVIIAAAAFLVIQNYIVYDDAGKAHIELPFGKKEPAQPERPELPDDVTIDYVDNGPKLEVLHARQLPADVLRQDPKTALAGLDTEAAVIETKRLNGAITYTTEVEVPAQVAVEQYDTMANLKALLAGGQYTVARMSVFCDS